MSPRAILGRQRAVEFMVLPAVPEWPKGQAAAASGAGARAQGLDDPRGPLVRQTLAGAVRRNAGEGRGQVAGLRREDALAAAAAAAAQGTVSGLRDAALLRTMSDALLRASEVAAIGTADIERGASTAAVAIAGRWKDPEMGVRSAKAHGGRPGRGAEVLQRESRQPVPARASGVLARNITGATPFWC